MNIPWQRGNLDYQWSPNHIKLNSAKYWFQVKFRHPTLLSSYNFILHYLCAYCHAPGFKRVNFPDMPYRKKEIDTARRWKKLYLVIHDVIVQYKFKQDLIFLQRSPKCWSWVQLDQVQTFHDRSLEQRKVNYPVWSVHCSPETQRGVIVNAVTIWKWQPVSNPTMFHSNPLPLRRKTRSVYFSSLL